MDEAAVKGIACACLLALLQPLTAAQAYEADIHYSTTYVLARAAGWPGADALTIASANQGVDENHDTVAALEVDSASNSLHQAEKNLRFHCFSKAHAAAVEISTDVRKLVARHFAEVPDRDVDPRANARRLIALGVALHCQQDAHAHVGFGGSCGSHSGSCLGHTYETFLDQVVFRVLKKHYFDPDHPGVSGERLLEALQGTVSELAAHRQEASASTIAPKELVALSDALRGSGLELPHEVRRECNRYIAGKWLYDLLRSRISTRKSPDTLERLAPEVAATCRNASLASAVVVRIPKPRFPRMNANGAPHLVRADGTYELAGQERFVYENRATTVHLSHWRQVVALPLMTQIALVSADSKAR